MAKCECYKNGECINNENGICKKYKSKDDGLGLHCFGSWSEDKIKHFKCYAEMFSTGMKNKWPRLYYIDLFSGSGKCINRDKLKEINGTCLEVLNLKDKFTKYFLIDKNPNCINDLKIRLSKYKNIEYYNNDCNIVIRDIIKNIPDYSLSLAIIDPYSLQFQFDSYSYLAKRKIDLIVNYPIYAIERATSSVQSKKLNSGALDKFHPGWKDIVDKKTWGNCKRLKIINLVKDYVSRVENLGYYSSQLMIPFKNIKNTTMYYLVYFTKNKKGIEFWDKKTKSLKNKNPQGSLF